jgi:hypothetical protein
MERDFNDVTWNIAMFDGAPQTIEDVVLRTQKKTEIFIAFYFYLPSTLEKKLGVVFSTSKS